MPTFSHEPRLPQRDAGPSATGESTQVVPLATPALLLHEHPLPPERAADVTRSRAEITRILDGEDDRLLVVVGPCSIHDARRGLEYAQPARRAAPQSSATTCCIVMRVYFEKPRTTVGWKGLINDPHLDGSFAINEGLRMARGAAAAT